MKEISDVDLRARLTSACAAARGADFEGVAAVASWLRDNAQGDDDPIAALIAALEYHLVLHPERTPGGSPFGPLIETEHHSYPQPVANINDVGAAILPLWARAAGLSPLRLVAARFADLLWEANFEKPHLWAHRAVDHYLAAIEDEFGSPIEISDSLLRALEVATGVNDTGRVSAVIDGLERLARQAIDSEENLPGVALRILDTLTLRRGEPSSGLRPLVDDAVARYRDDPWNLEAALNIRARLTPPAQRVTIHQAQVDAFADRARQTDGMAKYALLQHAIELATEHGLRTQADALRREIEALPPDALGMTSISVSAELPQEAIENWINEIVGDDDLPSALARFGSYVPTGAPDENERIARERMNEHPLQFLFTTMVIGPENSLLR